MFVNGHFLQTVGDWEFDTNLMYLGSFNKGDRVTVSLIPSAGVDNSRVTMNAASLDMEAFSTCLDELGSSQLAITSFSDGQLDGEINLTDDSALLLTIPFEEGWQATVNGEEVSIQERDGLMYIPLEAGNSVIRLQYTVPGQLIGSIVSVVGIAGFAVLLIWKKRKGRNQDVYAGSGDAVDEG